MVSQKDNRARYRAHNASRDAVRQGVRREARTDRRGRQTDTVEFPFQCCSVFQYVAGLGGEQRTF